MSVKVTTWVWEHSASRGPARLVLLAIADNAHDDGAQAWPSMTTLVRKTGLAERTVQAALLNLSSLGELQVDHNAGPRRCNLYRVVMKTPTGDAPPQEMHPAGDAGVQEMHPNPAGDAGETPQEMHPEPSVEPSRNRQHNVVAFRADIDGLCKLLADAIQINTGERPKVGKRWHDACRLLLDQDGYTAEQVEALIRWSQADEFWRSNILSMPKLRDKRLTLIGQMQRNNHSRPTSRLLAEDAKLARWAQTMEGGEDAAERVAPHRGQTRRELPRPGPTG